MDLGRLGGINMDEIKRERLEAAGFVIGDFEQFATEVLGMSLPEAREIQFRADLGCALQRIREARGQTRAKFAKAIGVAGPIMAQLEIGAPELPLDLLLTTYFTAGGVLRYEFELPAVALPAGKDGSYEPVRKGVNSKAPSPAARRKSSKPVKA